MVTDDPPRTRQQHERFLEVFSAVLLGLATFGSTWSAFEAARWNDEQGSATRAGTAARFEAGRRYMLALEAIAYDATIATEYARAVAEARSDLEAFYRSALVRAEFLPTIDAWLAQVRSGQGEAANLFDDTDYLDAQLADARRFDVDAEAATQRAEAASRNADGYVQMTVFMAIALFFAGINSNFQSPKVRLTVLGVAAVILISGIIRIAGLPFT